MGVDKTGKKAYLVTVDGRQSASVGMSLAQLQDYMRDIGCYNAVNLDGGGSTTFVSKEPRQDVISLKNRVSDGSMRAVANGVGIISTAPVSNPAIIDIYTTEEGIYEKTPQTIYANVYDEYYHNLSIPIDEISFSIDGAEGYFVDNVLYPLESGNATITARYKNITASVEKYVRYEKQQPETDKMKLPEETETVGTKIAVLGNTKYTNILGLLYANRAISKANAQADAIALVGESLPNVTKRATKPLVYGDYYYAAYKQNNVLIQIDNSKGGMLKANPSQWGRFLSQLDATTVNNVIITLNNNISAFENVNELNLFKQMLEEKLVDKGKNVFVIYDDNENTQTIENGIRYFGLKGIKGVKSTDYTSLKQCFYLLITSTETETLYQIKSIL
ncbi:MAG: hypothetical protein GX800_13490 [Clostridiaceae bacterium]|nr:hypothetical protein [Clostridiaceae bacterium]